MYGALDVSTSGMIAQRTRLDAIAANIANIGAVLDAEGRINPYRRRVVQFAPGNPAALSPAGRALGVHVASVELDPSPPRLRYDPTNPYAYRDGPHAGYVPEPNIDPVTEQINAVEAARAYEANVMVAEVTKAMIGQALRLLA